MKYYTNPIQQTWFWKGAVDWQALCRLNSLSKTKLLKLKRHNHALVKCMFPRWSMVLLSLVPCFLCPPLLSSYKLQTRPRKRTTSFGLWFFCLGAKPVYFKDKLFTYQTDLKWYFIGKHPPTITLAGFLTYNLMWKSIMLQTTYKVFLITAPEASKKSKRPHSPDGVHIWPARFRDSFYKFLC